MVAVTVLEHTQLAACPLSDTNLINRDRRPVSKDKVVNGTFPCHGNFKKKSETELTAIILKKDPKHMRD